MPSAESKLGNSLPIIKLTLQEKQLRADPDAISYGLNLVTALAQRSAELNVIVC